MRPAPDDNELFDAPPGEREPSDIQEGTVGWDGSPEVVELGTESGDGMTLVRVTLRHGHPTGKPTTDDGLFNGHQISARASGPLWDTPTRGTRVIVAFPGGDWETPGNAVVICQVGASPARRFGRRKAVLDFGDKDVVIRGRSVALISEDTTTSTPHRYSVSVDPQGGAQVTADGSGLFSKGGEVQVKTVSTSGRVMSSLNLLQGECSLMETSGVTQASVVLSGGNATTSGGFMTFLPGNTFQVGRTASPATPALVGPTAIAGIPSTFIFFAVAP